MSLLCCGLVLLAQVRDPQLDRVRAEVRAWFAAQRDGDVSRADEHRLRVLRAWPRGAAGDAWLGNVGRLRAVFDDCFTYDHQAAPPADLAGVHVPASYDPRRKTPAIVEVWPRPVASHARFGPRVAHDRAIVLATTPMQLQAMVQPRRRASAVENLLDMLACVAMSTPASALAGRLWSLAVTDDELVQRGLFYLIGALQWHYHVDRDRLVVDAAGSACGAVLRAVTTAPDRFAGVIVRVPPAVVDGALDNLAAVRVLVLSREDVDGTAAALDRALDAAPGGQCELRDLGTVDAQQLGQWCAARRRDLLRRRVTLVMRADAVVDGYWISDVSADVSGTGQNGPARIDVVAERDIARITVQTRGIERFSLLLNDALIDLDREFSLWINGVELKMRRSRSLSSLCDGVYQRFDPGFLFTTAITVEVPRRS